ncbi:MAG: hypothetical protein ACI9O0_000088 [Paracoccaceae bacterium]|jgi:hypothetical protein
MALAQCLGEDIATSSLIKLSIYSHRVASTLFRIVSGVLAETETGTN